MRPIRENMYKPISVGKHATYYKRTVGKQIYMPAAVGKKH